MPYVEFIVEISSSFLEILLNELMKLKSGFNYGISLFLDAHLEI